MGEAVGLAMPWNKKEPMDLRIEFAMKAMRTDNFRGLCGEYGISARTGYKWYRRFLERGMSGMAERSRRPRGHAAQLGQEEVCEMIRLKQAHRHWGPKNIRQLYLRQHGQAASESSFKRVLERAGLTEPRRGRQRSEAGASAQ
jgi:putative transposase